MITANFSDVETLTDLARVMSDTTRPNEAHLARRMERCAEQGFLSMVVSEQQRDALAELVENLEMPEAVRFSN